MLALGASDRRAQYAPYDLRCWSRSLVLCDMPRSLVIPIRMAMLVAISVSPVRTMARPGPGLVCWLGLCLFSLVGYGLGVTRGVPVPVVSLVGSSTLVVRCMVDTVRILDTFLDFGLSFHTMNLGGRLADMLLSLLISESMQESSSSSSPSSLWTRLTLENLTPGLGWPFLTLEKLVLPG